MSYEDDLDSIKKLDQKTNITQNILLTPIQQIKSGINPEDVKCKDDYALVIRYSSKNPAACVKPENSQTFEERGYVLEQKRCKKPIDLKMSTSNGTNPLTVGFFLNGTDNRCMKSWDFGDNKTRLGTYNIIENHQYVHSFTDSDNDSKTFTGYVNVTDPRYDKKDTPPVNQTFSVTVLKNKHDYIYNVNQLMGVIIEDNSAGFSISTKNVKSKTTWTFDEITLPTPPYRLAEHYKYGKTGTLNGHVKVTPLLGHPDPDYESEYWNFTVLVLPKMKTTYEIIAWEEGSNPRYHGDVHHATKQINFQCASGTKIKVDLTRDNENKKNTTWDFGDNFTKKDGFVTKHKYAFTNVTKNYLVTCDTKDGTGKPIKVWKSISIVPSGCSTFKRDCE
ncbi:hypothetical protein [Candidatus Nitrosotenuis sp. DW1]|uniref:hypothetical protein n=1 Tax=Candidatus Nitrosotenuis sp. DW1 TaxID=2259672 RepID=UPI0015CDA3E9|nr:hypothetical protein [Candidatus Nitrosotenuis sp. DW1]